MLCSFSQLDSTCLDTKQVASTDHLAWWTHRAFISVILCWLPFLASLLPSRSCFSSFGSQCSKFGIHDLQSFIQAPRQSPHPQNPTISAIQYNPDISANLGLSPPVCLWWPLYWSFWKKNRPVETPWISLKHVRTCYNDWLKKLQVSSWFESPWTHVSSTIFAK